MSRVKDLHILIVDDNPINRSFLSQVLKREQAHPYEAVSGEEALEQCNERRFDLIMLDVRMPGIGGVEVAQHLRKHPGPNRETPIIVLTADMSTIRLQDELPEDLVQAWMLKPVSSATLLDFIDNLFKPPLEPEPFKGFDAPIDLDHAARMVNHDLKITVQLLSMLADQLPLRIQEMIRLDSDGNVEAVREIVHGLHGSAGYCGAINLQEKALHVENLIDMDQDYRQQLMYLRKEALLVSSWIAEHLPELEARTQQ